MRIATILATAALFLGPAAAWAQSASGTASDKPARAESVKVPHASAPTVSGNDSDRVIDAELRRIDRMMTICNRC